MEGLDAAGGEAKRLDEAVLDLRVGRLDLVRGHFQRHVWRADAVEGLVVAADRDVALGADVAQYTVDDLCRAKLSAEDAAVRLANSRRQLRLLERNAPEQSVAGFFGAFDYAHRRYSRTAVTDSSSDSSIHSSRRSRLR